MSYYPELQRRETLLYLSAERIDQTATWQFMGGTGDDSGNAYYVGAISRGHVPLLELSMFADLEDNVSITEADAAQSASFRRTYFITYRGDGEGLRMFVDYLAGDLDQGTEGHVDMIRASNGYLGILSGAVLLGVQAQ